MSGSRCSVAVPPAMPRFLGFGEAERGCGETVPFWRSLGHAHGWHMPGGGVSGGPSPKSCSRAASQNPDDKSEEVFILGTLVSTDTDKAVQLVKTWRLHSDTRQRPRHPNGFRLWPSGVPNYPGAQPHEPRQAAHRPPQSAPRLQRECWKVFPRASQRAVAPQ